MPASFLGVMSPFSSETTKMSFSFNMRRSSSMSARDSTGSSSPLPCRPAQWTRGSDQQDGSAAVDYWRDTIRRGLVMAPDDMADGRGAGPPGAVDDRWKRVGRQTTGFARRCEAWRDPGE